MKVILISGNGTGAGKTYLTNNFLKGYRLPLALSLRKEVASLYPDYREAILSPTQDAKRIQLPSGKTVREELISHGQMRCKKDSLYWCDKWERERALSGMGKGEVYIIDDIRKREEVYYFNLHHEILAHFHLKSREANAEKEFDDLEKYATYIVERR